MKFLSFSTNISFLYTDIVTCELLYGLVPNFPFQPLLYNINTQ